MKPTHYYAITGCILFAAIFIFGLNRQKISSLSSSSKSVMWKIEGQSAEQEELRDDGSTRADGSVQLSSTDTKQKRVNAMAELENEKKRFLTSPSVEGLMSAIKNRSNNEFWTLQEFVKSGGQIQLVGSGLKLNSEDGRQELEWLAQLMAQELMPNLSPLTGTMTGTFNGTLNPLGTPIDGGVFDVYSIPFQFQGTLVEGAQLKIMVNKENQTVDMMQMDPVRFHDVQNNPSLSSSDVESILRPQLGERASEILTSVKPVINVAANGSARYVFQTRVTLKNPADVKTFRIDAETGQILSSKSGLVRERF